MDEAVQKSFTNSWFNAPGTAQKMQARNIAKPSGTRAELAIFCRSASRHLAGSNGFFIAPSVYGIISHVFGVRFGEPSGQQDGNETTGKTGQ
ncbi:hypothetical protein [Thioclava dalianensis]|uniref:hypothetical protein n=1 Tax=Thioclava dalianensis TaxID=1185766 RepID=UPI001160C070|nr:hypothetical protein [Thioclava dalianensis]